MSVKYLVKVVAVAVGLFIVFADVAQADKFALQEKLGGEVKINLTNVTIAEALEKIGQKAGE